MVYFFRFLLLLLVLALPIGLYTRGGASKDAPGRWQGQTLPSMETTKSPFAADMFLALDSGGSGGSFGKGDVRQKMQDIFFWDRNTGWACGAAGVFRSGDGGLTWERMLPASNTYHHVEMSAPSEIWLLEGKHPGGLGKAWLRRSVDDGKSWEEILPGKIGGYFDLFCRGSERWVICGGSPSYHSADGGSTWSDLNWDGLLNEAYKVAIPADQQSEGDFSVYVLGLAQEKLSLLRSDDSGKSWTCARVLPEMESAPARYGRLFFVDSRTGWIGLDQGRIFRTEDAGETWEACPLPTQQRISALAFWKTGFGLAAVQNEDHIRHGDALFGTLDGGRHWFRILSGAKHIASIYTPGPGRLWCAGDSPGFVYNDLILILNQFPASPSYSNAQ